MGAPNHCKGAEKSHRCHKYFIQGSKFASEGPHVRTWGQQTCFLPRELSNLVTPLIGVNFSGIWPIFKDGFAEERERELLATLVASLLPRVTVERRHLGRYRLSHVVLFCVKGSMSEPVAMFPQFRKIHCGEKNRSFIQEMESFTECWSTLICFQLSVMRLVLPKLFQ